MPKRMVDDSLLNSPSMAVLSPRAQDAFVRFILLADDFGCFEVSPRQLAAKGWPDRADVSEEDVAGWIEEYATKHAPGEPPVAMLWTERARRFCFLTGWFGRHGQRRRVEYDPSKVGGEKGSKRRTPPPPGDQLAAVMAGEVRLADGLPPGSPREDELSREIPPGKFSRPEKANPSDSVPAREMHTSRPGSAGFPRIPAAAVAVAVPDAGAVPAEARASVDPRGEGAAARVAILGRDETFAQTYPLTSALIAAVSTHGVEAAWSRDNVTRAAVEAAVGTQSPVAIAGRVADAIRSSGKPWLGMHLDTIRGGLNGKTQERNRRFLRLADDGFTPIYADDGSTP